MLTIWWCPCVEYSLKCWKRVFTMTSAFSWQNSVSLCPASFCTPRPNFPVTPGISDFLLLHSSPLWWKGHHFLVLVLKGFLGLHRAISGEGNGTPLQYSFLENPVDGGVIFVAVIRNQFQKFKLRLGGHLPCRSRGFLECYRGCAWILWETICGTRKPWNPLGRNQFLFCPRGFQGLLGLVYSEQHLHTSVCSLVFS